MTQLIIVKYNISYKEAAHAFLRRVKYKSDYF